MGLRDLPTLADLQQTRRPAAKPRPRVTDRAERKRDQDKRATAFRRAVWMRDDGKCRLCGRRCLRTLTLCPEQGHVHHLRGRNVAPEDRYNPKAAVLVCGACHGQIHAQGLKVQP